MSAEYDRLTATTAVAGRCEKAKSAALNMERPHRHGVDSHGGAVGLIVACDEVGRRNSER